MSTLIVGNNLCKLPLCTYPTRFHAPRRVRAKKLGLKRSSLGLVTAVVSHCSLSHLVFQTQRFADMLCSLAAFPPPVSQLTMWVLTTHNLWLRHYRKRLYGRTPTPPLWLVSTKTRVIAISSLDSTNRIKPLRWQGLRRNVIHYPTEVLLAEAASLQGGWGRSISPQSPNSQKLIRVCEPRHPGALRKFD